jgi:hypothetical protein
MGIREDAQKQEEIHKSGERETQTTFIYVSANPVPDPFTIDFIRNRREQALAA